MKKERGVKKNLIAGLISKLSPVLIFLFFVLVHLPDLGHDNFNTDVGSGSQDHIISEARCLKKISNNHCKLITPEWC